jgi:hypothetical protein
MIPVALVRYRDVGQSRKDYPSRAARRLNAPNTKARRWMRVSVVGIGIAWQLDGDNARVVQYRRYTGRHADMPWQIVVAEEVRDWLHEMRRTDRGTLQLISAAIDVLASRGPGLGRPLVDTVRGSKLSNLKELRPGSAGGSEIRILFAFNSERCAILLIGGDKSGNGDAWYDEAIPIAEKRYERNLPTAKNKKPGRRKG